MTTRSKLNHYGDSEKSSQNNGRLFWRLCGQKHVLSHLKMRRIFLYLWIIDCVHSIVSHLGLCVCVCVNTWWSVRFVFDCKFGIIWLILHCCQFVIIAVNCISCIKHLTTIFSFLVLEFSYLPMLDSLSLYLFKLFYQFQLSEANLIK